MILALAVGRAGGGLSNLAMDAAMFYFEGRKMSSGDMLKSFGSGCALSLEVAG